MQAIIIFGCVCSLENVRRRHFRFDHNEGTDLVLDVAPEAAEKAAIVPARPRRGVQSSAASQTQRSSVVAPPPPPPPSAISVVDTKQAQVAPASESTAQGAAAPTIVSSEKTDDTTQKPKAPAASTKTEVRKTEAEQKSRSGTTKVETPKSAKSKKSVDRRYFIIKSFSRTDVVKSIKCGV